MDHNYDTLVQPMCGGLYQHKTKVMMEERKDVVVDQWQDKVIMDYMCGGMIKWMGCKKIKNTSGWRRWRKTGWRRWWRKMGSRKTRWRNVKKHANSHHRTLLID